MIHIGSANWESALRERTSRFDPGFWADFRPVSAEEIDRIERGSRRQIDPEFREFYERIGFGSFPEGGNFYSPDEIIECLANPIFFVCGSLSPSDPWATEAEHRDLWLSRGSSNPSPGRFTEKRLQAGGIPLYDLLQFGTDGTCCYHQLYVGPEHAPARYCLLTPEGTAEDLSGSFSAAVEGVISRYEEIQYKY